MRNLLGFIMIGSAWALGLTWLLLPIFYLFVITYSSNVILVSPLPYLFIVILIVIIGSFAFMEVAYKVYTFGRRISFQDAAGVLKSDHRPPILLLRSFTDDHAAVFNSTTFARRLAPGRQEDPLL